MADRQIFRTGPVDAPFEYELEPSEAFQPLIIQAELDGSGAAGPWLPAVVYVSREGHVIGRAVTDSPLGAGDDAEVTWFPGVKKAPAAAGSAIETAIARSFEPYQIPHNGGAMNIPTLWEDVRGSPAFVWPSSGDAHKIGFSKPGLYVSLYSAITVASWPAPASGFIVMQPYCNTFGAGFISEAFFLNNTTSALFAAVGGRPYVGIMAINLPAPDELELFAGNATAVNFNMQITKMLLMRIGDNIPGTLI